MGGKGPIIAGGGSIPQHGHPHATGTQVVDLKLVKVSEMVGAVLQTGGFQARSGPNVLGDVRGRAWSGSRGCSGWPWVGRT